MFSIQKEAIGSETRFTKACAGPVFVNTPVILQQRHSHVIKFRTVELPQFNRTEICERYLYIGIPGRHVRVFRINNTRAFKQLNSQLTSR